MEWGVATFNAADATDTLKVEVDWAVFAPGQFVTADSLPSGFVGYNVADPIVAAPPHHPLYSAADLLDNGALGGQDYIYAYQLKLDSLGVDVFNVAFEGSISLENFPQVHGYGYIENAAEGAPSGMRLLRDGHAVNSLLSLSFQADAYTTSDIVWISSPDRPGTAIAQVNGGGLGDSEQVGGPVIGSLPAVLPKGGIVVPLPTAAPVIALGLVGLIGRRVWRGRRKVLAVVRR